MVIKRRTRSRSGGEAVLRDGTLLTARVTETEQDLWFENVNTTKTMQTCLTTLGIVDVTGYSVIWYEQMKSNKFKEVCKHSAFCWEMLTGFKRSLD